MLRYSLFSCSITCPPPHHFPHVLVLICGQAQGGLWGWGKWVPKARTVKR